MDFFAQQDAARRRTGWLVICFLMAVVAIVVALYLVALLILALGNSAGDNPDANAASQVDFERVHLTAMYFPTQYGTVVSTLGTSGGAGEPAMSDGRGLQPSLEVMTVADQAARIEAELAELRSRLDDVHRQLSEKAGATGPAPGEE